MRIVFTAGVRYFVLYLTLLWITLHIPCFTIVIPPFIMNL